MRTSGPDFRSLFIASAQPPAPPRNRDPTPREGTAMTRRYTRLMLVVALSVSGCAKPDWIQQTLVTVDVTGTWVGSCAGTGQYTIPLIEMTLEQRGPRVTGDGRTSPG